jgi:tetratricopeptide (TPR) repeat protein
MITNRSLIDDRYRHIFFVDANTSATIRGDLESAIRSIDGHEQDIYEGALAFMSKPPENGGWLYILDNADDPGLDLTPYLPYCSHGTIIITSRNRRVGVLSTEHHLELGPMQEREAVETLCRAGRKPAPLDEAELSQAIRLVELLGYLALAIVQAGIYVHEMTPGHGRFTFSQYSSLFEHHRDRLLRQKGISSLDRYPHGVYATLDISYMRLPDLCREFLHLCSFLRHTNIPISIFSSAASVDFEESWTLEPRPSDYQNVQIRLRQLFSRDGEWDQLQFHELIQKLNSFSLLSTLSIRDILLLRLHPLVHSHARDKLAQNEIPMYRQMVITCISTGYQCLPSNIRQYVIPHTGVIDEGKEDGVHINDMMRFGQLISVQGDYRRAEKMFRRIADTFMVVQGPDGKDLQMVYGWLADALRNQGKWNEAEVLEREVLSMRQRIFGLEHPETISASANLACTLWHQGKWSEAEVLNREALAMRQRILGLEHPDTIHASAGLASTLQNQGKWDEAEGLQREVLSKRQRIFGLEHPDTISASGNLASTLQNRGKWREAEVLQREVLTMCQRILGLKHPNTIGASASLATTLRDQGKWSEAEVLEREVLSMRQRILGLEHPDTISASANLASTLSNQGKWSEAEVLKRDVLAMRQKRIGPDHPDTIRASANLACTLAYQGKCNEAEVLEREVLDMRQRMLGPEHPDTILASANLACTLVDQGKFGDAEQLNRGVLAMYQKILGLEHPHTITSLQNLAATLRATDQNEEALSLSIQATQLAEKVMGPSHPNAIKYRRQLEICYESLERYEEASAVQRELELLGVDH